MITLMNGPASNEAMAMLRVHGSRVRYVHELVGINSRLDALQAAVLQVKLKHLNRWAKGRQHNAARYARFFAEANLPDQVRLPVTESGNVHVFNQFTIRAPKRDELRAYLKEKGIGTEIYYPIPLHLQTCYRGPWAIKKERSPCRKLWLKTPCRFRSMPNSPRTSLPTSSPPSVISTVDTKTLEGHKVRKLKSRK